MSHPSVCLFQRKAKTAAADGSTDFWIQNFKHRTMPLYSQHTTCRSLSRLESPGLDDCRCNSLQKPIREWIIAGSCLMASPILVPHDPTKRWRQPHHSAVCSLQSALSLVTAVSPFANKFRIDAAGLKPGLPHAYMLSFRQTECSWAGQPDLRSTSTTPLISYSSTGKSSADQLSQSKAFSCPFAL